MQRVCSVLPHPEFLWSPTGLSFSQTPIPIYHHALTFFLSSVLPELQSQAMQPSFPWVHQPLLIFHHPKSMPLN